MKVTIKDIANICGVSAGTVDRALNNRPGISEKTKKRVLHVAEQLNYRPDFMARSLVKGKTMTLGVVLFDLYNRSYAQLLNAIEEKSREKDYFTYIALTDKDPDNEKKCIDYLVNRRVDGIILQTVNQGPEFEDFLNRINIPIVTIFNYISDDWTYIGINERQAMKDAVNHVVSNQYEHFIYICPPLAYKNKTNIYTQQERLEGFLESLRDHHVDADPVIITERDYISELEKFDFQRDNKTAIVCSCDLYALEVKNYLEAKGLQIPDDVGLLGFDNIDMLKFISPRLTTVEYPIEKIGFKAVETIIQKIEKKKPDPVPLLDYRIIKGESI